MSTCLSTLLFGGLLEVLAVLVVIYLRVTAKHSSYVAESEAESSTSPLSVTLPASAFPKRANVYTCDECNRNVTKYLRPREGHVWKPMGPERFQCTCGRKYVTGATEWDHLGDRERRRRISQTVGLGIFLSAMASILGLAVYLLLYFVFDCKQGAAVVALSIAAMPFVLMQVTFWPFVAASIWRTRVGRSIEP